MLPFLSYFKVTTDSFATEKSLQEIQVKISWNCECADCLTSQIDQFLISLLCQCIIKQTSEENRVYHQLAGERGWWAVRELASHQCGPGLISARCHILVECVVGSRFALRIFVLVRRFSSLHKNQHLPIPIRPGQRTCMKTSLASCGILYKYYN